MPRPISSNASPEAQRAVVDGHFRGDLHPALLNVNLSIKSSLSSARCRARRPESRSAPSCLPEPRPSAPAYIPRLPCGPEGRGHRPIRTLWPGQQIAPLPALVLALPRGRQSADHRRRQVGSVCPATPPAPTGAMPAWIVRRAMTMPDDTGAPVSSPSAWQEMFHLRSQYRVPEAAAHDTQGIRQWSVDLVRLTKRANVARRIHGVSLSLGGSGRLDTRRDTRPISGRHSPRSRIAPYQVLQRDFWSAKPVSLRLRPNAALKSSTAPKRSPPRPAATPGRSRHRHPAYRM